MTREEFVAAAPVEELKRAAQAKVDRHPACKFEIELAYEVRRWAKQNLTPEQRAEVGL